MYCLLSFDKLFASIVRKAAIDGGNTLAILVMIIIVLILVFYVFLSNKER